MINTGIYIPIHLSRHDIRADTNLIAGAMCFWNPIFNHFRLRCGPMGPTIQDVCIILGLFADGDDINPYMDGGDNNYSLDQGQLAYSNFIKLYMKTSGPVSKKEYYCFFMYWISKYITCSSSQRVLNEYSYLAFMLSKAENWLWFLFSSVSCIEPAIPFLGTLST